MIINWDRITKIDQRMILPALVGFIAVVVNLVLTLNLVSSLVIGALVIVMMFFYKSFSRGWLILLGVALLFPSTRIGGGEVFLFDLFLIILIVVSLFQLALKDKKIITNRLAFSFFLLILIGFVMIVCGLIFNININEKVWRVLLSVVTFWFLLSAFQYFFQTKRRIRRFFMALISVGVIHSIFGILTFIFGSPTSSGLGISTVKTQHILFEEVSTQVTGFFGTGLERELGVNPLAGFLLITIMITIGFILVNFQQQKDLMKNIESEEDDVANLEDTENEWESQVFGEYIQRDYRKQRIVFVVLALIQAVALFLTFSYGTFLFFVIALFTLGILMKNKHIIAVAAAMIIAFTIIFPGFMVSNSSSYTQEWFSGVREIKKSWFFGNGVELPDNAQEIIRDETPVSNSYIYIWNYYGFFGFLVLVSMMSLYFLDIYKNFQRTQKAARIWYMIIFAIFVAIALEGFASNVLIIGPTAVVFWLLYGVTVNLRHKNIEFGLTETSIPKS